MLCLAFFNLCSPIIYNIQKIVKPHSSRSLRQTANLPKITLKSVPQAIKLNMTKCFRQRNIPHLFLIC